MMNRIVLGDKKISAYYDQVLLFEDGGKRVGICIDRRNDLGYARRLGLEGGGFKPTRGACSGDAVEKLFLRGFAKAGIAADFDSYPPSSRNSDDMAETPEAPGLVVYPDKPGLTAVGCQVKGTASVQFLP
jgi:hypothetical protein